MFNILAHRNIGSIHVNDNIAFFIDKSKLFTKGLNNYLLSVSHSEVSNFCTKPVDFPSETCFMVKTRAAFDPSSCRSLNLMAIVLTVVSCVSIFTYCCRPEDMLDSSERLENTHTQKRTYGFCLFQYTRGKCTPRTLINPNIDTKQ